MRPSLELYEQIDRYLGNTMSPKELADFQARLGSDPALQQEVQYCKAANDLIFDQSMLDLKSKLKDLDKAPIGGNSIKPYIYSGIGIVAISIIGYLALREEPAATPITQPASEQLSPEVVPMQKSDERAIPQRKTPRTTQAVPQSDSQAEAETGVPAPITTEDTDEAKTSEDLPVQIEQIVEETNEQSEKPSIVCKLEESDLKIKTIASCNDAPTGSIDIDAGSTFTGKLPVQYSLNGRDYSSNASFKYLQPGTYYVSLKDSDGCTWYEAKEIVISEKACAEPEFAFSPDRGEVWKYPIETSGNYNVQIFNRIGSLVYQGNISNGFPESWDGTANGQAIPMGSYSYKISNSEKIYTGFITIIR